MTQCSNSADTVCGMSSLALALSLSLSLLLTPSLSVTSDPSCDLDGSRYSSHNNQWPEYLAQVERAREQYSPCVTEDSSEQCSVCYNDVVDRDLSPWQHGVSHSLVLQAGEVGRATKYQVVGHRLYRSADCMFPFRCRGLEHFLTQLLPVLEDTEFVVNVRDWPQVNRHFGTALPVFSFSKVPGEHLDILYPAWAFWAGGPAISLYPQGLGRWDRLRESLSIAAKSSPWQNKSNLAFFRGSRTSSERDPLVKLGRRCPSLVDAQYTKNQGWKSEADTLGMEPAEEASLEAHCDYRYLFNYRGVAASFRLKHLFLCRSLVVHVGNQWEEFFYPALRPWIHYVPLSSKAREEDIMGLLHFLEDHQDLARNIADAGADFITAHLTMDDVSCYWKTLLSKYTKLLSYTVTRDTSLVEITNDGP